MKVTTIRLGDDLAAQVELIADVEGTSVSDVTRRALSSLVETKREDATFRDAASALLAQRDAALRTLTQPPSSPGRSKRKVRQSA
jgi:predicted transcriptional regulator